ncbi:MAG TPA: hypothetical protein VGX97_10530 [bacterium]|nr:hypothetical protein [bacterium]
MRNPAAAAAAVAVAATCVVLAGIGLATGVLPPAGRAHAPSVGAAFTTPYQAVFVDNGQVYFGRLSGLGTPFPVLRDVYYVQRTLDPKTKTVKNVLVPASGQWNAPDRMVLNASHIVAVEPVSPASTVAKLIATLKGSRQP